MPSPAWATNGGRYGRTRRSSGGGLRRTCRRPGIAPPRRVAPSDAPGNRSRGRGTCGAAPSSWSGRESRRRERRQPAPERVGRGRRSRNREEAGNFIGGLPGGLAGPVEPEVAQADPVGVHEGRLALRGKEETTLPRDIVVRGPCATGEGESGQEDPAARKLRRLIPEKHTGRARPCIRQAPADQDFRPVRRVSGGGAGQGL
jgi:hypothetical protein